MADVSLRVGQKIQVSRGDDTVPYNSSIQDVQERVISIAMPFLQQQPLILHKNDQVTVQFVWENDCYAFTTSILGQVQDNIILYRLAYPTEIQRVQQRMHCRLPVDLDIQFAMLDQDQETKTEPADFIKAVSLDISGGGMRIATRELLQVNDLLLVKFTLPLKGNPQPMELRARVVRIFLADPATQLYHVGIKFESISRNLQDKIVRFTFERMALQKRLL